jgi:hypothetical protein
LLVFGGFGGCASWVCVVLVEGYASVGLVQMVNKMGRDPVNRDPES